MVAGRCKREATAATSTRGKRFYAGLKAKGAFVSESALHSFDGDKPNSVGSPWRPDDHSSHPSRMRGTNARSRGRGTVVRRYPRILSGRLPFLCFVLHRMGFFVPRELLHER